MTHTFKPGELKPEDLRTGDVLCGLPAYSKWYEGWEFRDQNTGESMFIRDAQLTAILAYMPVEREVDEPDEPGTPKTFEGTVIDRDEEVGVLKIVFPLTVQLPEHKSRVRVEVLP